VVKEIAAAQFTRGQSASGLFGQDDAENFERVQDETRAPLARKYPFHYGMALGHDGRWPGSENWIIGGMPGLVGPCFSEHVQRQFYQYWVELMRAPTA